MTDEINGEEYIYKVCEWVHKNPDIQPNRSVISITAIQSKNPRRDDRGLTVTCNWNLPVHYSRKIAEKQ
jgi:hypothetical protein